MTRSNRKRGRNAEEESSEFMPLSKRINNLHINGFSGLQENTVENMDTDWESRSFMPSPNYSEPSQDSPLYDGCSSSQSSYTNEYRPDLDANENPFYYESNKLLFSLYMERVQRTSELYWCLLIFKSSMVRSPVFFTYYSILFIPFEWCVRVRGFSIR